MRVSISLAALTVCAVIVLVSCKPGGSGHASPTGSGTPADAESVGKGDDVRLLSVGEVRDMLEKGEVLLVDVRTEQQYGEGHIKGALSLPKEDIKVRLRELPEDKLIVYYCACPAEHLSIAAALDMRRLGRQNVAALVGGLRSWIKEGLPTESSPARLR